MPVNQPENGTPATNQRDSQMAHYVDDTGESPSVNYEPSITGGLAEGPKPAHEEQGPEINARLTRARIPRTDDYRQAGERYQLSEPREKDDLVGNLSTLLGRGRAAAARPPRQQRPARRRGPRHDALRAERARVADRGAGRLLNDRCGPGAPEGVARRRG